MLLFQKRLTAFAVLVAFGIALLIGWIWRVTEPEQGLSITITTATEGGTYIVIGEQLARILVEYPGDLIGQAVAISSGGSVENIDRLLNAQADLGLVMAPVLATDPRRDGLRVLMSLYSDTWQVVIRRSASIGSLSDLRGKHIYIGAEGSGTKWGAEQILQTVDITESAYERVNISSYSEASEKLQTGEADAAFFITATPANAIANALSSGCCELLDLQDHVELISERVPGLEPRRIPPHVYDNQPDPVETLATTALLISRTNVRDVVVLEILNAVFDQMSEFAVAHIRVQDIRLETAFTRLPEGLEFHPAVLRFLDQESQKLRIATGVINGTYYELGKRIQLLLEKKGIVARVIHTDGSVENLRLVLANENTLAIAQYDVALAALWSEQVYSSSELVGILDIPSVEGLRRIAALHEESVHVVMRRDRIPDEAQESPTLAALADARVSMGPIDSGTQILARVLLHYHGISPSEQQLVLSVSDTVAQIGSGEIDAGFFVSYVPSEAFITVLQDDRNRLLSVDPRQIGKLIGVALSGSRIESSTYGAQRAGEPPIDTLTTRAVLVARKELPPAVVRTITEAIFEGEAFLGIEGGAATMAEDMRSLPLHPGARAYYEREGFVPRDWWKLSWEEIVGVAWRILAIVVILVAGYQGALKLRRDRTNNEIGRRIFAISLESDEPDSVHSLLEIRDGEIRERVQRRWWRKGELDQSRWRYLHDLINDRIRLAKENLTAALAEDLRELAHETGSDVADRRQRLQSLEARVWTYFQKGELDASHQSLLMEVIQRNLR
ncbi:MAG: TAXI family TRAP transporter solute-binding subunit [Gemmatimonadetes bacterium]|nr:MAG: TAXI family TRAP transporter solute-binding subunit [Gemmatimonadota bacterium]